MIFKISNSDGQLARADYGGGRSEDFLWDGLALVRRGGEQFVNEPHPGNAPKKLCFEGKPRAERSARRARKGPRGSPVLSSEGAAYLNDLLGTTVGVRDGPRGRRRHTPAALTAFGEPLPGAEGGAAVPSPFFTGKPDVPGLGRVFLFRNYRPGLAKWQTADPLGYPDGWNQLAYCGNDIICAVDLYGACRIPRQGHEEDWTSFDGYSFGVKGYWTCNHDFNAPNIVGHWSENVEEGSRSVIENYSYLGYDAVLIFSTRQIANTFTLVSTIDPFNHVYNLAIAIEVYVHVSYIDEQGIEKTESMWDRPGTLWLTNHHTITRQEE